MPQIELYQASLPLLRATLQKDRMFAVAGFLGSATLIDGQVCTCKHVLQGVDFRNEVVITTWDLKGPWVVFTGAHMHERYDFAVLTPHQPPPFKPLILFDKPLYVGTTAYAAGYHLGRVDWLGTTVLNIDLAPRIFFGNVVRVWEASSNVSPSVCELSFATLSGFSGCALISSDFTSIFGMIYGNSEQSITVHSKTEVKDGVVEFRETVSRIMDLGLFHSAKYIRGMLRDLT